MLLTGLSIVGRGLLLTEGEYRGPLVHHLCMPPSFYEDGVYKCV
jgi:hypothetical protein